MLNLKCCRIGQINAQIKQTNGKVKNKMHIVIANGSFCACGLSIPITPPIIQGTKLTTAKKILNIQKSQDNIVMLFPLQIYIDMESLARLVLIIFLSIYFCTLLVEILGLIYLIKWFFPMFGGWWYCLWIPILMSANWLLSILILIFLSKIGSKG